MTLNLCSGEIINLVMLIKLHFVYARIMEKVTFSVNQVFFCYINEKADMLHVNVVLSARLLHLIEEKIRNFLSIFPV